MSEGCFRYYFLDLPSSHPYQVDKVWPGVAYSPPGGLTEITSLKQVHWGLRRFIYDAMLYWGNFRQAYKDLRMLSREEIGAFFAAKQVNIQRISTRGKVAEPSLIPQDSRYLISEMACKTYEIKGALGTRITFGSRLRGFGPFGPKVLRSHPTCYGRGRRPSPTEEISSSYLS